MNRLSTCGVRAKAARRVSSSRCGWKIRLSCARYMSKGKPTRKTSAIFPAVSMPSPTLGLLIDLRALLHELDRLLLHALLHILAHVLRDLHRAEVRAAHRAEVRHLHRVLRQG